MAITVSLDRPSVVGDRKMVTGTITFDSSYPTGGEDLTAATLGLTSVDVLLNNEAINATPVAIFPRYVVSTAKLLAFWDDYDLGADGGFIQVTDTTDLSAYSFRFVAFGH